MLHPSVSPFDSVTGDLLPAFRDAYLRSELPADQSQAVERYLKADAVQKGVALARWHQLAEAHQGALPEPPAWVREQLRRQVSVSGIGPLRRPVVRLALLVFVTLSGAATVQWIRQEPLVPEPVARSVRRVAESVQQATQQLVAAASPSDAAADSAQAAAERAARKPKPKPALAEAKPKAQPQVARSTFAVEPIEPVEARPLATPATLAEAPAVEETTPAAETAAPGPITTVTGSVRDHRGQPLIGATVFVKGTKQGASTDAKGSFRLEAPSGATLQFGYVGFLDKQLKSTGEPLNVALEPEPNERRAAVRRLSSR